MVVAPHWFIMVPKINPANLGVASHLLSLRCKGNQWFDPIMDRSHPSFPPKGVGLGRNHQRPHHRAQKLVVKHRIGDGHQPNSKGLYSHYKDSLLKVDDHPQYKELIDLGTYESTWIKFTPWKHPQFLSQSNHIYSFSTLDLKVVEATHFKNIFAKIGPLPPSFGIEMKQFFDTTTYLPSKHVHCVHIYIYVYVLHEYI